MNNTYYPKQSVKHKNKKLHEASFHSWSKSGKRVGIMHNAASPFGVHWVIDWYDPKNIEGLIRKEIQ